MTGLIDARTTSVVDRSDRGVCTLATGYWTSLDGVRGLAVLAVVLVHMHVFIGGGGDFGVTAFFVLSGFLITLIIAREHATSSSISFRRFYQRRALRLLPALLLVVVVVGLGAVLKPALFPVGTVSGVPISLLYVGNLTQSFGWSNAGALGHTWSLAMEEQFYLAWPPLFGLLLRERWHPGKIALALSIGAAVSAGWTAYLWHLHPGFATAHRLYFAPDVEAQPLLIGCALAVVYSALRVRWTPEAMRLLTLLSHLALAAMACMILVRMTDAARYSGGLTVFSLCAATLIFRLVVVPPGLLDRVLSVRPLVGVGRISYGVYLWNYPVEEVVRRVMANEPIILAAIVELVLSIGLAAVSYRVIEQRFLRRKAQLTGPAPRTETGTTEDAPLVAVTAA